MADDFDPVAYLAAKRKGAAAPASTDDFDPAAYLATKRGNQRPTAIAGQPSAAELALAEPPDEVPLARSAPGEARTPDGVPLPRDPKAVSTGESAALGALQGFSGGYFDEAHGILGRPQAAHASLGGLPPADYSPANAKSVLGDLFSGKIDANAKHELETRAAPPPAEDFTEGYRERRDEARGMMDSARKENPGTFTAAEIAGSIASPVNRIGPAPVKGAGALSSIARAGARGALQGAVVGAGSSTADLTSFDAEKAKQFARDAGFAAAAGGVVGVAGEGAAQAVRGAATHLRSDLERRILNEVAEGTANTTPTGRKRLEKAGEAIVKEVVEGPDGDAVRAAYNGPSAAKGREQLRPILEKVATENDTAYTAFENAGRGTVPLNSYLGMLELRAREAVKDGQTRLAKGIRAVKATAAEMAAESGGLDLRQLRGFTTEVQGQMTSVLGSLNEHANAKTALQVQSAATQAMDDVLSAAAHGKSDLQKAASAIRDNNQRFHALLTIDDSLRLRSYKEGTGAGLLVRGAKAIGGAGTGTAAAAVLSGDEDRTKNMALGALGGAALGLALPAARTAENLITTAAIKGARGELPKAAAVEAAARTATTAATRTAIPEYIRRAREIEEERKRRKAQP